MPNDDYDAPWKEALARYFPEFLAFYFPQIYELIDWTQPFVFLDQELAQLAEGVSGKRVADKLVRVCLHGGAQREALVHVEVQTQRTVEFTERMYICNYRAYDRHRLPVISLAVLADASPVWRPHAFSMEVGGCRVRMDFPVVKLLDYMPQIDVLLEMENVFALLTSAHLMTLASQHDPERRLAYKRRVARLLYRRQWSKRRIINLFNVIDWLMRLPDALEQQLWQELRESEQGGIMPHMLSIERIIREESRRKGLEEGREEGLRQGVQEGIQQGMQQGIQQGMQQGMQQGRAVLLAKQLRHRFGVLPALELERLAAASDEQLDRWALALLHADTLEQVFSEH
jgi:hypothetical protein